VRVVGKTFRYRSTDARLPLTGSVYSPASSDNCELSIVRASNPCGMRSSRNAQRKLGCNKALIEQLARM
jgi:hypothetical protein